MPGRWDQSNVIYQADVYVDNKIMRYYTSHSAYVATETKLVGAKIDGLLPPNFL